MEKRKLLLVAVSVGVFLVIVLSAAILIFTPGTGGTTMAGRLMPGAASRPADSAPPLTGNRGPASADAADMVKNAGDLQGLKIPPSGIPAISVVSEAAPSPGVSGNGPGDSGQGGASASAFQETNVYINGKTPSPSSAGAADTTNVVINVPKPSAPGVPAARSAPAGSAASGQGAGSGRQGTPVAAAPVAAKPAPAAVKPAPASAAAPVSPGASSGALVPARSPAPSGPASPARSPSAPARNTPPARSPRDYWIQTGAFSALVRAEDVKETLASKGLSSIIDDREVEGQTWYRVRVGPYTSENEANYWLALVRAIDGFDGSQVRSTQR